MEFMVACVIDVGGTAHFGAVDSLNTFDFKIASDNAVTSTYGSDMFLASTFLL